MSFLSRFFSRPQSEPLVSLDAMLAERGIPADIPGLDIHRPEFEHLDAAERRDWMDALAELHAKGHPLPPLWEDAQYELLPQIVPHWQAEREGLLHLPIYDGLCKRTLACGQVIPRPWLTIWGISEEEVEDRALIHLEEASKGKPFQRLPSGLYQSDFGDGLDACRILLPSLWESIFPGQNTFLAIPTNNKLIICPQVLLPKLVDAIGPALEEGGQRISATIYQHIGQTILPANLQDPHPIAQPQRELRQSDLFEACRAQNEDLDPELGQPAELLAVKTQQGRALLMALWKEGVPCLLPDADLVGFLNAQGKTMGIYFRQTLPRINEIRGETLPIWGPRRTRYTGFPTQEQMDRLEPFATAEQMASLLQGALPKPPAAQPGPMGASASSSPVPEHLRGLNLGPVRKD